MECALLRRKYAAGKTTAVVTITGSVNTNLGSVEYGGVKYYGATDPFTVTSGDTIVFTVSGYNTTLIGHVNIDGVRVLEIKTEEKKSYAWTVPSGVGTIDIEIVKVSGKNCYMMVTTA